MFGDGDKHGLSHSARNKLGILSKYVGDLPSNEADFEQWAKENAGWDPSSKKENYNNAAIDMIGFSMISAMNDPTQRAQAAKEFFTGGTGKFPNPGAAFRYIMLTDDDFAQKMFREADPTNDGNHFRKVFGDMYQGDHPGPLKDVYDRIKQQFPGSRLGDMGDFTSEAGKFLIGLHNMGVQFGAA